MGGIKNAISKVVKNTIGGGLFGGSSQPKTPEVVRRDPQAEAEAAQQQADMAANKQAAEDKKKRKTQSLLSAGGERGNANGKNTLGS